MLALARAVATSPRLLMLDELSMGLAPIIVDELYNHVVQLAAEGITVVVVEQFARTALSVATSAMVMANGRIVQTGAAATWSRCSSLPISDPLNPRGRVHRRKTGRRTTPTP
jgi:branched-chain amino acid transport system ATP-binding protein